MIRALGITGMVLLAGCGWTLPDPDVRRDVAASDGRPDVVRDAATTLDTSADLPPPEDSLVMDVPVAPDVPTGFDVPVDVGFDVPRVDVGDDRPAVFDLGVADVPVDRGVSVVDVSIATEVGADSGEIPCMPGERRSCYPGLPASRGRGYCRDGVETCDPTGRWGGTCVGAFVPDCTDRRCGSDDCGGTCGTPCADGQICDDLGRCVVPSCGAGNFTETCADGAVCPSNSNCTVDNLCACRPGYVGRTCAGVDCGTACTYPDWYCARASFCGAGAITCAGGITCPRHSTCGPGGQCVCAFGFMAVTCAGVPCTSCPGTDYRCVR